MSTIITEEPKQPLILTGDGYGLEIAPSYQEAKITLLKNAAVIVDISDPVGDAAADKQIKLLAAMRIDVEKSRTAVKRPALDFGNTVDAQAKSFVAEILIEEDRLKKARGSYSMAVIAERNRVLREMEAKRQEEARRLQEEENRRLEAERKVEAERKAAEDALWNAETPEEKEAAEKGVQAAESSAVEIAATPEAVAAPLPTQFVPAAPKGVKMVPAYEVTDIHALYQHNTGLVTLSERRKEILEAIERGMVGDTPPHIPGLRIFMQPKVSAR